MLPNGVAIAGPHGEEGAFRQRAALGAFVFRIQHWTSALLLISCSACGSSAATASMRCLIGLQAWSSCWIVAASPVERWVLIWNQQRVEFFNDGSGHMMTRVGQDEDWLEVQPFWTADQSLCWGAVCVMGAIPLE